MIGLPVLSPAQLDALTCLCVSGRATAAKLAAVSGAGPSTLTSLVTLGLMTKTAAGARDPLYHLTDIGRVLVCEAINDDDSQGGPNMPNAIDIITEDEAAAPTDDAPAPTPAKRRGRKTAEMAAVAAGDAGEVEDVTGTSNPPAPAAAKKGGPTVETTALYKATVKAVKAVAGRGAKGVEKQKYLRVGDAQGKTVAYVNFPTSKSVLVEIPRFGSGGYDTVKVTEEAHVEAAAAVVQAFVTAREAAKAAA